MEIPVFHFNLYNISILESLQLIQYIVSTIFFFLIISPPWIKN